MSIQLQTALDITHAFRKYIYIFIMSHGFHNVIMSQTCYLKHDVIQQALATFH